MTMRVAWGIAACVLVWTWSACDLTEVVQACSKPEQCPLETRCDLELGACVRTPVDGGTPDGGQP